MRENALEREARSDLAKVKGIAAIVDAIGGCESDDRRPRPLRVVEEEQVAADLDAIAAGTLEPLPEPESGF